MFTLESKGKRRERFGREQYLEIIAESSQKLKRIYQAINSTSTKKRNKSKYKETISNTTRVQFTNSKEKQNTLEVTRGKTTVDLSTTHEIKITAYFSTKMINTRK